MVKLIDFLFFEIFILFNLFTLSNVLPKSLNTVSPFYLKFFQNDTLNHSICKRNTHPSHSLISIIFNSQTQNDILSTTSKRINIFLFLYYSSYLNSSCIHFSSPFFTHLSPNLYILICKQTYYSLYFPYQISSNIHANLQSF